MSRDDEIAAVTAQINDLLTALNETVADLDRILTGGQPADNGMEGGVHERQR